MSADTRFYRQLFLRRYALLLEKAEQTFQLPADTMQRLRSQILCLDWVDVGVEKLKAKTGPTGPLSAQMG